MDTGEGIWIPKVVMAAENGQVLSAIATFEQFLLGLWVFFYSGHAGLVIALYSVNRRLSAIEAAVVLLAYTFGWLVNLMGIMDVYQHLQHLYLAMGFAAGMHSDGLRDYYQGVRFWGLGGGLFDRQYLVRFIYGLAFAFTATFIIGCHLVSYESRLKQYRLGRFLLDYILPRGPSHIQWPPSSMDVHPGALHRRAEIAAKRPAA